MAKKIGQFTLGNLNCVLTGNKVFRRLLSVMNVASYIYPPTSFEDKGYKLTHFVKNGVKKEQDLDKNNIVELHTVTKTISGKKIMEYGTTNWV